MIIPKDTKVKIENGKLILTGPKGSRELTLNDKIFTTNIVDDKSLILKLIKKMKLQISCGELPEALLIVL